MAHEEVQLSAGGVVLHEGRLLLIETRGTGRWQLPKGHLEPGETSQQAAVREVREETGAAVTVLEPVGDVEYRFRDPLGRRIHKRVEFYLCAFTRQVSEQCDPREVRRAAWHPWDRALELLAFDNERELVRASLELLTAPETGCSRPPPAPSLAGRSASTDATPRGDRDGPEAIP